MQALSYPIGLGGVKKFRKSIAEIDPSRGCVIALSWTPSHSRGSDRGCFYWPEFGNVTSILAKSWHRFERASVLNGGPHE